jgi:hypothetical protein
MVAGIEIFSGGVFTEVVQVGSAAFFLFVGHGCFSFVGGGSGNRPPCPLIIRPNPNYLNRKKEKTRKSPKKFLLKKPPD